MDAGEPAAEDGVRSGEQSHIGWACKVPAVLDCVVAYAHAAPCLASWTLQKLRSQLRQPLDRLTVTVMPFHHPLHNIPPGALPPEDVTTCLR